MSIGRISGPLLRANLLRDEVDLAFETDLVYLDVNTHAADIASALPGTGKVGIKTSTPLYDLDVNGTTNSTVLRGGKLELDEVEVNDNIISTTLGSLVLKAATETDLVEIQSNTKITGDLEVVGTYTIGGDISLGNGAPDTININANFVSNIVPNADSTYSIGSSANAWKDIFLDKIYSPNGSLEVVVSNNGTVDLTATTALKIPVGTEAQKSNFTAATGQIRFNSTSGQFEGYQGTVWSSLGGVKSADGLTYITAESTPGSSDDTIRFYANNNLQMSLDTNSLDVSSTVTTTNFDATTESTSTSTGAVVVDGGVGIAKNLNVGGNATVTGNITVSGTAKVDESVKITADTLGNGTIIFTDAGDTAVYASITAAQTGQISLNDASGGALLNFNTTGDASFANDVNVSNGAVNALSAEIGTLGVTGNATVDLNLEVLGDILVDSSKTVTFKDLNNDAYVAVRAPDVVGSSYIIKLPASQPTTFSVLGNDGTGTTSWTSPDTFGGNRIYVSKAKGSDSNDGVNLPVLSIKKALQLSAGMTKPVTIMVAAGDYYIDNPVIVPDNVSIVGDSLRSVVIRPLNANKDMFRVRNGSYMTGITFRDGLNGSNVPSYTFAWAVAFDDPTDASTSRVGYTGLASTKPIITLSPYIQNCSVISFLGGNGVLVDGNKVLTPNVPTNTIEVENPVNLTDGIPEQGKSMVANAFTMLSFGGTGWLVINDAYAQIVSCFQIFMLNGSYCQSGGYLSITNSATNFGLYALRASGYSPNSFAFDRGTIAATGTSAGSITLTTVGTKRAPVSQYVIRIKNSSNVDITSTFKEASTELSFNAATAINTTTNVFTITSHGLQNTQSIYYSNNGNSDIPGLINNGLYYVYVVNSSSFKLFQDESLSVEVDITAAGTGTHKFIVNSEEFFVGDTISSHGFYQELTLAVGSYSFTPGETIKGLTDGLENTAYVSSYDSATRKLIVSNELSTIGGQPQRVFFTGNSTITSKGGAPVSYDVDTVITLTNVYYTSTFKAVSTQSGNQLLNSETAVLQKINFHRPSIVNSSAHTWEFAGAGTDYNALPQNGGNGRGTAYEQYSELPGRVYTSGTNELGDFKVGDFIVAENKTGNITFKTQVTIGELSILKLSLSDVEVTQFSTDPGLGDNEPGGPSNARISVQRAVRTFIANRLGNVLDKDVSTNAVPGAVVQLNSQGQINQDLLPPARGVTTHQVEGWGNRIYLADKIPAVEVISGDNASESYAQIQLTLNTAVTWLQGDVITQQGTSGYGIVKENYSGVTEVILVNESGTWNTTNNLIKNGTVLTGTTITIVGEVVNIVDNYYLKRDTTSQFLILSPGLTYNFTGITSVTGANSAAQGTITSGPIYGIAYGLDTANLVGGLGYSPASGIQVYTNVPLTNVTGSGSGAKANITVSNGSVTNVELVVGGTGYAIGNILSASIVNIGGTGSGFQIPVLRADTRLYVNLTGNYIKFTGSQAAPEYIEDASAPVKSITNLAASLDNNFDSRDVGVGGQVNYALSTITLPSHGLTDGDPVVYSTGGGTVIGNLVNSKTYWVKVLDINTIELYNNYGFTSGSKVVFGSSTTGTQTLSRKVIGTVSNFIVVPGHGLLTAQPVRFTATTPPTGLSNNGYYFVGSITTNSFTLHTTRSDAVASVNGITANAVAITSTGSGSATFTVQNVQVIGTLNTSSTVLDNWGQIAQSTIDASNIVSGVIGPTRLGGTGTATNKTFLRGDSSWQYAVQNIKAAANSPISVSGDYFTTLGVNYYYNALTFDIARADEAGGDTTYTSLGVAAFNKTQFNVNASGQATIKTGVIDAGTLDGQDGSYYLDPANITGFVPISKAGTGLTTYTKGDMLYSGSANSLTQLAIGANKSVLTSDGQIPVWTTSPTFGGNLSVEGNVTLGSDNTDTITTNGYFVTGTQLKTAKAATNTLSLSAYDVDGAAYTNLITLTASNTPTVAITSTGVGSIDNITIGGTTRAAGSFTTLTANNSVTFTQNTASTSTTSGTLVVTGGVGISGALYANSLTSGTGSALTITAGLAPDVNSNGMTLALASSNGGASSGNGGPITITSGTGPGAGGDITITTGQGGGRGGNFLLSTGNGTGYSGGDITLSAGNGANNRPGGAITITGGWATTANVKGSNVTISAGNGTGTGGSGEFLFNVAPPGTAGSTFNTPFTAVNIKNTGTVAMLANIGSTSTTTGTLVVTGGVGISEKLFVGGTASISGATTLGGNLTVTGNAIVNGDLTVNGTTTTFNTTTLTVDDKNIDLGAVTALASVSGTITGTATTTTITGITSTSGMIPGQALTRVSGTGAFGGTTTITSVDSATQITITSTTANTAGAIVFDVGGATDVTANGGGITLRGTTDKTFTYDNANTRWQSNISLGVNGTLTVGTGSAAGTVTSQGTQNLVLNTNAGTNSGSITITQGANANIDIEPNGTGDVNLNADTVRVGDANAAATITTNGTGNLTLSTNAGTNSGTVVINQGANGNIDITPNGTGDVNLVADTVVVGDANAAATVTTNGTGNLTLSTNAGTNSGTILINQGANANIEITPNGTGDVYLTADLVRVGDANAEATISSNGTGNLKLQTGSTNTGTIVITQGDNGNIVLTPHGTGDVQVDADTLRVGDSNAAATITTNGTGNLVLNTNGGTTSGSITINQGANGNIEVAPDGTGDVYLTADTVRIGDAATNATLTTNGAGDLILKTGSTNSGSITITQGDNANITLAPHGTGDVNVDADTLRVGDSNADATITTNGTGDLILNTNAGTNSGNIRIYDGTNGNIDINANGTGNVNVASTTINLGTSASSATTVKVGGAITSNTLKIASTTDGTVNLTSDVTNGTVNVFTGTAGGTVNVATGIANAIYVGGAASTLYVGAAGGNSTIEIRGSSTAGGIALRTNVTTGTVAVFQQLTTGTMNIGSAAAGTVAIAFNKASTSTTTGALTVAGGVGINGALNALTKSFVIPHPTKKGKLLRHGSLEGPEFGVYVRGRCTGTVIELPEYWLGLVDEDTITVDLTPVGKHQKLYVEKIEGNKVYIANDAVFGKGVNCFYTVWGERKDVDRLDVEVDE